MEYIDGNNRGQRLNSSGYYYLYCCCCLLLLLLLLYLYLFFLFFFQDAVELLVRIDGRSRQILKYLLRFLYKVAQFGELNKMSFPNLGMVFVVVVVLCCCLFLLYLLLYLLYLLYLLFACFSSSFSGFWNCFTQTS